ncbi:MAG: helix-turn-helix domain-containing protein [Vicinamibacterales bacterium]
MPITLRLVDDHALIDLRALAPDVREAFVADLEVAVARARALTGGVPGQAADLTGHDTDPTAVERTHVQRALERARGNKKLAAELLGVSRRALYRRLERLQLGDTITRRPNGPSF